MRKQIIIIAVLTSLVAAPALAETGASKEESIGVGTGRCMKDGPRDVLRELLGASLTALSGQEALSSPILATSPQRATGGLWQSSQPLWSMILPFAVMLPSLRRVQAIVV